MSGKFALIIGNTEYTDPGLAQLTAPSKDAEDFARVLKDTEIGAFDDVVVLLNQAEYVVREAIDDFFNQKMPDDLLVLYFSGHGVRDELGALYLAVKNTIRSKLRATGIKSDYIREAMDQSRSRRQVLVLDCCNSGAFAYGTKAETGGSVGTKTAFEGGYGRVILTASDSTQFAWEGDKIIGDTDNSLFTHFLIEGLEGEADIDGDGRITVDELYDYAYEKVKIATPKQTPSKFSTKQQGEIILRHHIPIEEIRPAPLPDDLLSASKSSLKYVREAAVRQLADLLKGDHLGLARSAQEVLELMAKKDDSNSISRAALLALNAVRQGHQKTKLRSKRINEEKHGAEAVIKIDPSSASLQKEAKDQIDFPKNTDNKKDNGSQKSLSNKPFIEEPEKKQAVGKKIFISHASNDQGIVERIARQLQSAGLSIWLNREKIRPDQPWQTQVVQAIDECDTFILMLSAGSANSDYIRKEVDLAQDSGRNILIIKLDTSETPKTLRYQLAGLQPLDFYALGFERGVEKLISHLNEGWGSLPSRPKQSFVKQVELIIQGVDLSNFNTQKQQELLNFVSNITSANHSELRIAGLAAGSVRASIEMPITAAYELKTLALNKDYRFKEMNIHALRLQGSKEFVIVSLGVLTGVEVLEHAKRAQPSGTFLWATIGTVTFATILIMVGIFIVLAYNFLLDTPSSPTQRPSPIATQQSTPTIKTSKSITEVSETAPASNTSAFPLELCSNSTHEICIYAYSPQPTGLTVTLLYTQEIQDPQSLYLTVNGQKYDCQMLALYPGRLYCSGALKTGVVEIAIFASDSAPIATGRFDIPKYVAPSPPKKDNGGGSYP